MAKLTGCILLTVLSLALASSDRPVRQLMSYGRALQAKTECSTSADCAAGQVCERNLCGADKGQKCKSVSDCAGWYNCDYFSKTCTDNYTGDCQSNDDCTGDLLCVNGTCGLGEGADCSAFNRKTQACGGNLPCVDGVCAPSGDYADVSPEPEASPADDYTPVDTSPSPDYAPAPTSGDYDYKPAADYAEIDIDYAAKEILGSDCTTDADCAGSAETLTCLDQVCGFTYGQACELNKWCAGMLLCTDNKCADSFRFPCDNDDECSGDLKCVQGLYENDPETVIHLCGYDVGHPCTSLEECGGDLICNASNVCAKNEDGADVIKPIVPSDAPAGAAVAPARAPAPTVVPSVTPVPAPAPTPSSAVSSYTRIYTVASMVVCAFYFFA